MNYFQHIAQSIIVNYKSWAVLFISAIIMNRTTLLKTWSMYLVMVLYAYVGHRIAHEPFAFMINRAHIYHHENTDWTSHLIQVCIEISASLSPLVFLYYILKLDYVFYPFDPYIITLMSIFYISTHNINYGLMRVNKVHSKHHQDYSVNYGPDFCDIIFRTKYPKDGIENTDHYIPNIIVATIITFCFRHFYEKTEIKQQIQDGLMISYSLITTVVVYFTTKKMYIDINNMSDAEVERFNYTINSIYRKLYPTRVLIQ